MPLQNRVDPFSRIRSDPSRGMFTGNRGCLHDGEGRIVTEGGRQDAWVTCRLEFAGRRRALMAPGRYTHLFFLDEATALAAGHRPCGECRRADYLAYCEAASRTLGRRLRAPEINPLLRAGMLAARHGQRESVDASLLPSGAMAAMGEEAFLVQPEGVRRWSFQGYGRLEAFPLQPVRRLTPAISLAALEGGYRPALHPSAMADT